MKTVLLFSSIFYLLGLKMGNTVELFKKLIAPVKSIMSAPAPKPEKPEKSFFYKPDEIKAEKKPVRKKKANAAYVVAPATPQVMKETKSTREELLVH
jgi:hypothetical protein